MGDLLVVNSFTTSLNKYKDIFYMSIYLVLCAFLLPGSPKARLFGINIVFLSKLIMYLCFFMYGHCQNKQI